MERITKILKNNKGVSLAEIVVAMGIFATVVYIFTGSSSFLNEIGKESMSKLNVERIAHDLYQSMQQNIGQYQVTYDASEFYAMVDKKMLMEKLPLAWNERVLTDVANCKGCKGRLGYVITPLTGYRGLYKLTVRVTHKDDQVINSFSDYNFLISGK